MLRFLSMFSQRAIRRRHLYGVLLCARGLSSVLRPTSLQRGRNRGRKTRAYSNAIWGDILCLLGAFLCDVQCVARIVVKAMDRVEYLGMLGFWNGLCLATNGMLDPQELADKILFRYDILHGWFLNMLSNHVRRNLWF